MAVYSMTGYASRQSSTTQGDDQSAASGEVSGRIELEIRSVNSRFLDLTFRLPDELRAHEPWLRDLLRKNIRRGKVEVRAQIHRDQEQLLQAPSPALLQKLGTLQAQVAGWLPEASPLTTADILRLGTSHQPGPTDRSDELRALAQATLKQFLSARQREGASLASVMIEKIEQLRALGQKAQPMIPQVIEQQRQRFLERWREALAQTGTPESGNDLPERGLAELTAYAIRIDVDEELARLQAHLDESTRLLQRGGEIGKRLEFLIQELHREANTLGSKSTALEMTQIALDMKVLIEQLREQVQNIE